MQIGDKVRVIGKGKYHTGQEGIIDSPSITRNAWVITFDSGGQASYMDHDLLVMLAIKVGDRVKLVGNQGWFDPKYKIGVAEATVLSISRTRSGYDYKLLMDDGGTQMTGHESDLQVVSKQNPQWQGYVPSNPYFVPSQNSQIGLYSSGQIPYYSDDSPTVTFANPTPSGECRQHKWQFYQGLNHRDEFCTNPGCKARRDTDKRA